MKIGVISDIHENFHNLLLTIEQLKTHKVDHIICLGDFINKGIIKILATCGIPVSAVWGNNDGEIYGGTKIFLSEDSQLSIAYTTYDFLTFDNRNIFISHFPDLARPMAQSGNFDAVFFGHTHIPQQEYIQNCLVLNPGEISAHKTKQCTFALYNTLTNKAKIIPVSECISFNTPLVEKYFKNTSQKYKTSK